MSEYLVSHKLDQVRRRNTNEAFPAVYLVGCHRLSSPITNSGNLVNKFMFQLV